MFELWHATRTTLYIIVSPTLCCQPATAMRNCCCSYWYKFTVIKSNPLTNSKSLTKLAVLLNSNKIGLHKAFNYISILELYFSDQFNISFVRNEHYSSVSHKLGEDRHFHEVSCQRDSSVSYTDIIYLVISQLRLSWFQVYQYFTYMDISDRPL